jgi:hypothetical protein
MSTESFWEPEFGPEPPEPPEPCQYCSVVKGALTEHDGTCDSLTKERWVELTKDEEA